MGRIWRALPRLIVFVLIVLATLWLLGYVVLTRSLPKVEGTLKLKIIERPVQVYRDSLGVPHILADSPKDLFAALGYVSAQDRLWQMDLLRRAAAGRLSEIFGNRTVEEDKLLRLWGFHRTAEEIVPILSKDARDILQSYVTGVNAFIDDNYNNLPIEFALLGYKPEPWQIEDSIAFARLMAWRLSFGWHVEAVLHQLVRKLGFEKAKEVFPDYPKDAPLILSQKFAAGTKILAFLRANNALRELLGFASPAVGSNAWVVSGRKTICGKPLLANDPHLDLRAPSIWYQAHLSCPDFNAAGVMLPGIPSIVIGHNQHVAWGLTNGMIDDIDFYQEQINPEDSAQYWDGQQWLTFGKHLETIQVKDSAAVQFTFLSTRNGTVVSDIHPVLKDSADTFSVRWVGNEPSDEFTASLKMLKARNGDEFRESLRGFKVPTQNFVFASTRGDIGYQLAGAVPIRANSTGILPHEGWRHSGQWIGEIPFDELPAIINPDEGFIATANNKIVGQDYPYYLSNLWEPSGRIERIREMLIANDSLNVAYFQKMQQDEQSVFVRQVLPGILAAVQSQIDSSKSAQMIELRDFLSDWDGTESKDSIAPTLFHAFLIKLLENTFADEMGDELFQFYIKCRNVPFRVISAMLLSEIESEWFDDIDTDRRETRDEIIGRSLLDGAKLIEQLVGPNISYWRWGDIHALRMKHPLGSAALSKHLLNIGPIRRGGSTMTINNSEYQIEAPFESVVGPSMRQVVDLCDLKHSLSIISTGASGQCMSDHYADQTKMWAEGRYHTMVLDWLEINANAPSELSLLPVF